MGEMHQATELLPCPFCGSDKVRMHRRNGRVGRVCPSRYYREFVKCEQCEATGPVGKKPNVTIGRWNRTSQQAAAGLMPALRSVLHDIDHEIMPVTVETIKAALSKAEGRSLSSASGQEADHG